ncbi:hypothetical protein MKX03_018182 [Papaver bracteatum]|nr:hypothetical protein MKX03_018182 [Papaver bracteatum]
MEFHRRSSSIQHHHRLRLFVLILSSIIQLSFLDVALSLRLPDSEVEALKQIGKTLGVTGWKFDATTDPCTGGL